MRAEIHLGKPVVDMGSWLNMAAEDEAGQRSESDDGGRLRIYEGSPKAARRGHERIATTL